MQGRANRLARILGNEVRDELSGSGKARKLLGLSPQEYSHELRRRDEVPAAGSHPEADELPAAWTTCQACGARATRVVYCCWTCTTHGARVELCRACARGALDGRSRHLGHLITPDLIERPPVSDGEQRSLSQILSEVFSSHADRPAVAFFPSFSTSCMGRQANRQQQQQQQLHQMPRRRIWQADLCELSSVVRQGVGAIGVERAAVERLLSTGSDFASALASAPSPATAAGAAAAGAAVAAPDVGAVPVSVLPAATPPLMATSPVWISYRDAHALGSNILAAAQHAIHNGSAVHTGAAVHTGSETHSPTHASTDQTRDVAVAPSEAQSATQSAATTTGPSPSLLPPLTASSLALAVSAGPVATAVMMAAYAAALPFACLAPPSPPPASASGPGAMGEARGAAGGAAGGEGPAESAWRGFVRSLAALAPAVLVCGSSVARALLRRRQEGRGMRVDGEAGLWLLESVRVVVAVDDGEQGCDDVDDDVDSTAPSSPFLFGSPPFPVCLDAVDAAALGATLGTAASVASSAESATTSPSRIAVTLFTTGSTGAARRVDVSERALRDAVAGPAGQRDMAPPVELLHEPLSHYNAHALLLSALARAGRVLAFAPAPIPVSLPAATSSVVQSSFPSTVWHAAAWLCPSALSAVPRVWVDLADMIDGAQAAFLTSASEGAREGAACEEEKQAELNGDVDGDVATWRLASTHPLAPFLSIPLHLRRVSPPSLRAALVRSRVLSAARAALGSRLRSASFGSAPAGPRERAVLRELFAAKVPIFPGPSERPDGGDAASLHASLYRARPPLQLANGLPSAFWPPVRVWETYGTTETGMLLANGRPVPGVRLRIRVAGPTQSQALQAQSPSHFLPPPGEGRAAGPAPHARRQRSVRGELYALVGAAARGDVADSTAASEPAVSITGANSGDDDVAPVRDVASEQRQTQHQQQSEAWHATGDVVEWVPSPAAALTASTSFSSDPAGPGETAVVSRAPSTSTHHTFFFDVPRERGSVHVLGRMAESVKTARGEFVIPAEGERALLEAAQRTGLDASPTIARTPATSAGAAALATDAASTASAGKVSSRSLLHLQLCPIPGEARPRLLLCLSASAIAALVNAHGIIAGPVDPAEAGVTTHASTQAPATDPDAEPATVPLLSSASASGGGVLALTDPRLTSLLYRLIVLPAASDGSLSPDLTPLPGALGGVVVSTIPPDRIPGVVTAGGMKLRRTAIAHAFRNRLMRAGAIGSVAQASSEAMSLVMGTREGATSSAPSTSLLQLAAIVARCLGLPIASALPIILPSAGAGGGAGELGEGGLAPSLAHAGLDSFLAVRLQTELRAAWAGLASTAESTSAAFSVPSACPTVTAGQLLSPSLTLARLHSLLLPRAALFIGAAPGARDVAKAVSEEARVAVVPAIADPPPVSDAPVPPPASATAAPVSISLSSAAFTAADWAALMAPRSLASLVAGPSSIEAASAALPPFPLLLALPTAQSVTMPAAPQGPVSLSSSSRASAAALATSAGASPGAFASWMLPPVWMSGAVLVTGGTGFLGAHAVAALLAATRLHGTRIVCLVRPSQTTPTPTGDDVGTDDVDAVVRGRLHAALARFSLIQRDPKAAADCGYAATWPAEVDERVTVCAGDIAAPYFGLPFVPPSTRPDVDLADPAASPWSGLDAQLRAVTAHASPLRSFAGLSRLCLAVLHCAGNVNHTRTFDDLRAENAESCATVAAFAALGSLLRAPQLAQQQQPAAHAQAQERQQQQQALQDRGSTLHPRRHLHAAARGAGNEARAAGAALAAALERDLAQRASQVPSDAASRPLSSLPTSTSTSTAPAPTPTAPVVASLCDVPAPLLTSVYLVSTIDTIDPSSRAGQPISPDLLALSPESRSGDGVGQVVAGLGGHGEPDGAAGPSSAATTASASASAASSSSTSAAAAASANASFVQRASLRPISGYARSKLVGERLLVRTARALGFPCLVFSPGHLAPSAATGRGLGEGGDFIGTVIRRIAATRVAPPSALLSRNCGGGDSGLSGSTSAGGAFPLMHSEAALARSRTAVDATAPFPAASSTQFCAFPVDVAAAVMTSTMLVHAYLPIVLPNRDDSIPALQARSPRLSPFALIPAPMDAGGVASVATSTLATSTESSLWDMLLPTRHETAPSVTAAAVVSSAPRMSPASYSFPYGPAGETLAQALLAQLRARAEEAFALPSGASAVPALTAGASSAGAAAATSGGTPGRALLLPPLPSRASPQPLPLAASTGRRAAIPTSPNADLHVAAPASEAGADGAVGGGDAGAAGPLGGIGSALTRDSVTLTSIGTLGSTSLAATSPGAATAPSSAPSLSVRSSSSGGRGSSVSRRSSRLAHTLFRSSGILGQLRAGARHFQQSHEPQPSPLPQLSQAGEEGARGLGASESGPTALVTGGEGVVGGGAGGVGGRARAGSRGPRAAGIATSLRTHRSPAASSIEIAGAATTDGSASGAAIVAVLSAPQPHGGQGQSAGAHSAFGRLGGFRDSETLSDGPGSLATSLPAPPPLLPRAGQPGAARQDGPGVSRSGGGMDSRGGRGDDVFAVGEEEREDEAEEEVEGEDYAGASSDDSFDDLNPFEDDDHDYAGERDDCDGRGGVDRDGSKSAGWASSSYASSSASASTSFAGSATSHWAFASAHPELVSVAGSVAALRTAAGPFNATTVVDFEEKEWQALGEPAASGAPAGATAGGGGLGAATANAKVGSAAVLVPGASVPALGAVGAGAGNGGNGGSSGLGRERFASSALPSNLRVLDSGSAGASGVSRPRLCPCVFLWPFATSGLTTPPSRSGTFAARVSQRACCRPTASSSSSCAATVGCLHSTHTCRDGELARLYAELAVWGRCGMRITLSHSLPSSLEAAILALADVAAADPISSCGVSNSRQLAVARTFHEWLEYAAPHSATQSAAGAWVGYLYELRAASQISSSADFAAKQSVALLRMLGVLPPALDASYWRHVVSAPLDDG